MRQRRRKIDYNKKAYTNPFFRKKRKINISYNRISLKNKIFAIILFLATIFIFSYLLFSNYFHITNIEINGLIRVPKSEVESIINKSLNKSRFIIGSMKNIFLLDKEKISSDINSELFFEKLEIKKKLPNTLIINIQEKSQSIIWCENEKYYFADIDGYLINELNPLDIKQNEFPIIENKSDFLIDTNKISIKNISHTFSYIIKLKQDFNNINGLIKIEKDRKLSVEKFILTNELDTVSLKILDGPFVYINTKEAQEKQLNKLLVIINEKLKKDFFNKEYIDLRYGERVYYR